MVIASVAGASGYAGGELLRLLLAHPSSRLVRWPPGGKVGRTVGEVHPNLVDPRIGNWSERIRTPSRPPTSCSGPPARRLGPARQSAVDRPAGRRSGLTTACGSPAWQSYYPETTRHLGTYGLPELPGARERIAESLRVANPGCYPTSVILGLSPFWQPAWWSPTMWSATPAAPGGRAQCHREPVSPAKSRVGVGLPGRRCSPAHARDRAGAGWAADAQVTVRSPLLAPMSRGILATTTGAAGRRCRFDMLRQALHDAHAHEPFRVSRRQGGGPASGWSSGSNGVAIGVAADSHAGRAVVVRDRQPDQGVLPDRPCRMPT